MRILHDLRYMSMDFRNDFYVRMHPVYLYVPDYLPWDKVSCCQLLPWDKVSRCQFAPDASFAVGKPHVASFAILSWGCAYRWINRFIITEYFLAVWALWEMRFMIWVLWEMRFTISSKCLRYRFTAYVFIYIMKDLFDPLCYLIIHGTKLWSIALSVSLPLSLTFQV